MKRSTRIIIFLLMIIGALLVVIWGGAGAFLSRVVTRELNKALTLLPEGEASFGEIQLSLLSGSATVNDVQFSYRGQAENGQTQAPGCKIRVERIELGRLSYAMLSSKEVLLNSLTIVRPSVELWLDEEHPELSFPAFPHDTAVHHGPSPIKRAELRKLQIKGASFALHSVRTPLDVKVNRCSVGLHHLSFDSVFHYSDPQDYLSVDQARVCLPEADIRVNRVEIGPLLPSDWMNGEILVKAVKVYRPQIEVRVNENQKKKPQKPIEMPLKRVGLQQLLVENASLALRSTCSKLDVKADSCSVALQDIAWDGKLSFCDSLYRFSLAQADVVIPDGTLRIETQAITNTNGGDMTIGATRIAHTMPKKQLADMVEEPATWIDMRLERAIIDSLNPIRKAMTQDYTVNHITAVVDFMDVFRDERYKPHHIFSMPQQVLMELPVTFDVQCLDAEIKKIHVAFAATNTNIGHLDIAHVHADVAHITNRRGETLHAAGYCPFGTGQARALFNMTMNEDCAFTMGFHAEGINTSVMDGFIRPLVGMTSDCMIDTLDTHWTGDHSVSNGAFRMLYHGFKMEVHQADDIPYRVITKNAKTFNSIGNSLIPKSNPKSKRHKPNGYQITWKRNATKPTELYLFGPLIDGVKKTFLPGLYVHMRVKDGEIEEIN